MICFLNFGANPPYRSLLTVEGYFKPEEWTDQDGAKRQRVVLVATKFYETPEKEETPQEEKKTSKKGGSRKSCEFQGGNQAK